MSEARKLSPEELDALAKIMDTDTSGAQEGDEDLQAQGEAEEDSDLLFAIPEPLSDPATEQDWSEHPEFQDLFESKLGSDVEGFYLDQDEYNEEHGFAPDVAGISERAKKKASQFMQKLKHSRAGKAAFILAGIAVGAAAVEQMPSGEIPQAQAHQEQVDDDLAEVMADPEVRMEVEAIFLGEIFEGGGMREKHEAMKGKKEWKMSLQIEYAGMISRGELSAAFDMLHRPVERELIREEYQEEMLRQNQLNQKIIDAYRSPRGRVENYKELAVMMLIEFQHSTLIDDFTQEVILDAAQEIPQMESEQAIQLYRDLSINMNHLVGLRSVIELSEAILEATSPASELHLFVDSNNLSGENTRKFFEASVRNSVYFDQVTGRARVHHETENGKTLFIDSFPANGGPANAPAYGTAGLRSGDYTRTMDGNFHFVEAIKKYSWSWQNSWIQDDAPLRGVYKDDKLVGAEYKDENGKWRLGTGKDAVFGGEQPFRRGLDSYVYRIAKKWDSEKEEYVYPMPFTLEDFKDSHGNIRKTWEKNVFGPLSIHMLREGGFKKEINGKLVDAKREDQLWHSSPSDEGPGQFLENSHGCIHVKPDHVLRLNGYLKPGSLIRISSVSESDFTMPADWLVVPEQGRAVTTENAESLKRAEAPLEENQTG